MVALVVDSSVWIDYLEGRVSAQTDLLDEALIDGTILMGDLILLEILQGARSDERFDALFRRLGRLPVVDLAGSAIAVQAARNYRMLRAKGITIRKTIDTLIATRCIMEDWPLLYSDRDFNPFVEHLGLRRATN